VVAVVCGLCVTFYCAAGCGAVRQSGQLDLHAEASIEVVGEIELVNIDLWILSGFFDDTRSIGLVEIHVTLS
jgi:hypothetical protein